MAGALQEQPELAPAVQRVRRTLDAEDFAAARRALPELRRAVDGDADPGARRQANRARREVDEGTGSDAYWRQPTWKRVA